tara:strand:+ start:11510 stop:12097 length:588 start_codon:yes stop_codon:yes gene_type:complete
MNIETVSKWIQERQSLYPAQMQAGAKIPNESIWKMLENANYAPSHKRTEPWRYVVFSDEMVKDFFGKLSEIYQSVTPVDLIKQEKIKKFENNASIISHVIAICMKRDEKQRIPVQEEEYAVACSVQNMLLSMKVLNIIGYWSTGALAFTEQMKEYLALGKDDKCMGFLLLGVPKKGLPEISKQQISEIQAKVTWR